MNDYYTNNRKKILEKAKAQYSSNKEELTKKSREFYQQNKEKIYERNKNYIREWTLKNRYGITLEEYNLLLEKQNYKCAICGNSKDKAKNKTNLSVDHDHKTNKVRGLLCHSCNTGLGSFRDSPEICINAANYLRNLL